MATLYVVATPIGNMGDISARARETLAAADLVASEDTRRTGLLLQRLGLRRPQVSFHAFNEERVGARILGALREGRDVALVSDAGTPGVSDPGYSLVRLAIDHGLPVTMVPGPSALIMALVLSGLPSHSFTFRGFPPRTEAARRRFLDEDAASPHTLIYYESPHRLARFLRAASQALGERPAAVCIELTKRFEDVRRGGLGELATAFEREPLRGEATVVIQGLRAERPSRPPEPAVLAPRVPAPTPERARRTAPRGAGPARGAAGPRGRRTKPAGDGWGAQEPGPRPNGRPGGHGTPREGG